VYFSIYGFFYCTLSRMIELETSFVSIYSLQFLMAAFMLGTQAWFVCQGINME